MTLYGFNNFCYKGTDLSPLYKSITKGEKLCKKITPLAKDLIINNFQVEVTMTDLTKELAEYARLDQRMRELNDEYESLKREKNELESKLLPEMAESGIQNLKVSDGGNGYRTVFIHRQIWAGHNGDKQALCDALKVNGLIDYVGETFNSNQISAWVREFDPDKALTEEEILSKIPSGIAQHLKVTEKFSLKSKKS